ncbi:sister chromatid cohesion protein 1 [Castilleja foliolosa]|uniref:Sister chromatid cohesion protein 1 n=1 Tax=Castilleja foliolosa TaxID=1961234 RepID=A0ABD3BS88_9LAMI
MDSIWTAHVHTALFPSVRSFSGELQFVTVLKLNCNSTNRIRRVTHRKLVVRAVDSDNDRHSQNDAGVIGKLMKFNAEKPIRNVVTKLQESIGSVPVFVFSTGKLSGVNLTIGFCIVATMLVFAVRGFIKSKTSPTRPGSVADLVRRGQLRSDRRGISTSLKYEDPFNNPMVKVNKSNSTVEMCGKVYRLAPVALTDEIQTVHQKRRSRAYQWKRPTMFLKEGDSIPPDVDPDTIRWIPANHPFATTSSDIDEGLAQNNVYQKHGVPFRIQAEHEALQRKLEALQNDQKFSKLAIDPGAARDFERPYLKSDDHNNSNSSSSHHIDNPFGNNPPSEETQNP